VSQEIYNRIRSGVTILFMVGIAFISFKIGTLVGKEGFTPADDSIKSIQLEDGQVGSVKDVQAQLTIDPETPSTTYSKYIYEPDYSALLISLKREKNYLETYRGVSWYEAEKTQIEEEHNNRSQYLFKYYIDIINHYEFLISQCGDPQQAQVYEEKAQEVAAEFDVKKQAEETLYQQELADLESRWGSFQARLQTVQKLIKQLEADEEPDEAFWSFYYQLP